MRRTLRLSLGSALAASIAVSPLAAAERVSEPGDFDYYALVMSWSPTHCATPEGEGDRQQCGRWDGRRYAFVLHGLWPQFEHGYPNNCRTRRRPFVPEPVIDGLLDVMPSKGLIIHEYRTHGTCSGLEPQGFFQLARRLFDKIEIPSRYKNPFETQFVGPDDLADEFIDANPGLKPDMIAVSCGGPGSRLVDVRICFGKNGEFRACGENENQGRLCRTSKMHVPPVRSTKSGPVMPDKRNQELPRPRLLR